MTDRYTKFILTVIALCLVWISVRDTAPPAHAAQGTIDVNIEQIGDRRIPYGGPLPVAHAAQGTIDVNIEEIGGGYIPYGGPLPVSGR